MKKQELTQLEIKKAIKLAKIENREWRLFLKRMKKLLK